jgi:ADYC domain-containing protein
MTKLYICRVATLCAFFCACEAVGTSTAEQPGTTMQGTTMQGTTMQGTTMQGMSMLGFQFDGATLGKNALVNVRVERGELIAERNGVTLRGTALVGARLLAQVRDIHVSPPATALARYRITDIVSEAPAYDPTHTGSTFLYTLEQWVPDSSSWQLACPADTDNRHVAIPLAAIWDEHGDRIESSSLFTFGCTYGVIAKCYRWGYRPWVTGYGDLTTMHWTCTRLARADYCGHGVSNTRDGTWINIWDDLPPPGPIQKHGGLSPLIPPPGMIFEAGWSTRGAVCLSHDRWITVEDLITLMCPDRLIPPSLGGLECDNVLGVNLLYPSVHMFNESFNLDL